MNRCRSYVIGIVVAVVVTRIYVMFIFNMLVFFLLSFNLFNGWFYRTQQYVKRQQNYFNRISLCHCSISIILSGHTILYAIFSIHFFSFPPFQFFRFFISIWNLNRFFPFKRIFLNIYKENNNNNNNNCLYLHNENMVVFLWNNHFKFSIYRAFRSHQLPVLWFLIDFRNWKFHKTIAIDNP